MQGREGSIDLRRDTVKPSKAYAGANNSAYDAVEISAVNSDFVTTLLFNVGPYGAFKEGGFNGYSEEIRRAISLCIDCVIACPLSRVCDLPSA